MILVDRDISKAIEDGRLVVRPLVHGAVQPASIDLHLGPKLLVRTLQTETGWYEHHLIDDGPYRLERGAFVLGATLEWVEIPDDLVGKLDGKSSRAREGIVVENAGYVDPGWKGELTLELATLAPGINLLMVGMAIVQLRLHRASGRAARPYGSEGIGRYQESRGPVESRAVTGRAS